jgi:ribA/ribD-fused uncharacterized protein
MTQIDVWNTYYKELKVTKSDLKPYLVELEGHKIGNKYAVAVGEPVYTLVLIDNLGHIVLVDSKGIGKTSTIKALEQYKSANSEHFDWLTWRGGLNGPYKHGPLSNFWPEPDGFTLEHRFASLKTTDLEEKRAVMLAGTAGVAKKLGRQVTLRPDWDEIKRDLMWDLLLKKFMSDDFAREYLLATEDKIIREKNTWNDRVWGVNLQNQGQNLLGMGLMYVREALNV